ncbi:MAG: hypothetical protein MRK00_06395 [Nitrosomonas sp.]|nr:hypothetical protein [Nitrosomonas sp.]
MNRWLKRIADLFSLKSTLKIDNAVQSTASGDQKKVASNTELSEENKRLFDTLRQFMWIQGEPLPLIFDLNEQIYTQQGITHEALKQLEACGLINFEPDGFVKKKFGKHTRLFYCGKPTKIGFPDDINNQLDLGCVKLTEQGKALASDREIPRNQAYYEYVIGRWYQSGYTVSSIQVDQ